MISFVLLGVNVLLLVAVWHWVFKPAIRDFVRDKLFDIRDDIRDSYCEKNGLGDSGYALFRDIMNHHIRLLEERSLSKTIYFQTKLNSDSRTVRYLCRCFDEVLSVCGPGAEQEFQNYQKRANRWLKFYLVHSSFCVMLVFYALVFHAVAYSVARSLLLVKSPTSDNVRNAYIHRVDSSFEDGSIEVCCHCAV